MNRYLADLWIKIRADAVNAAALISTAFGELFSNIDQIATQLGDPNLTEQIKIIFHADAKMVGHWLTFVGIVGLVARFKRLVQSPPKA